MLNGTLLRTMPSRQAELASTEAVAERIRLLREALGLDQAELCRRTGINKAAWNNAETADNRLGVDNAMKLRKTFGIGTDYVYAGDFRALPTELASKIGKLMAAQKGSRRA